MKKMNNFDKKILLFDGNYFGHRLLHGVRIANPAFTLDEQDQITNFDSMLNNALVTIYKSFNNDFHTLLTNVIFVFDNYSWRKHLKYPVLDADGKETGDEELFKPYYIGKDDDTLLGYKENRKKLKESTDINWENFDASLKRFKSRIESVIPSFDVTGAEGDDSIFFLCEELSKNPKTLTIIFATDGDLKSNVKDNVIYFKNVKSGKSPDGEFVISPTLFDNMFGTRSVMEIMLGTKVDNDYFKTLFKIDISNPGNTRSNKIRLENTNIYPATQYKDLLIKIICGDKKDNILPMFRWTKNNKHFKVTELMISKAFNMIEDTVFDEATCKLAFEDKNLLTCVLVNLCDITKEPRTVLKFIGKHFHHNKKLNLLSYDEIPASVYINFNQRYHQNLELIEQTFDILDLQKLSLNTQTSDSARSLMIDSLPSTEANENSQPNPFNQFGASSNPLVNEILNS